MTSGFFSKRGVLPGMCLMLLSVVADRCEFTLDYSLRLATVICLCALYGERIFLPHAACRCDCFELELLRTLLRWPFLTLRV